jgi:hypothetical protein
VGASQETPFAKESDYSNPDTLRLIGNLRSLFEGKLRLQGNAMSLENDEIDLTIPDVQPQPVNGGDIHPQPHVTPYNPPPASDKNDVAPKYAQKLKNKKAKDKTASAKTEKTQTAIPVRTPDKQWFFRAHPDPEMTLPVDILEIKGGPNEGIWFLDPDVNFPEELEPYTVPAMITRCITADNVEFFYLAKQSAKSPKDSTRRCIREAKYRWIKQCWNGTSKAYDYEAARQLRREPKWADTSLDELLDKAFGDKFISRPDHEVVNCLLFPEDDDQIEPE